MIHFQQENIDKAWKLLSQFTLSDRWYTKNTGHIWVIKKNLVEILLLIEKDEVDLVFSRLQSFRKKHGVYLKKNNEKQVFVFVSLLIEYYKHEDTLDLVSFKHKVENTLFKKSKESADIFDKSFYSWLKSKINKTNLYETTLQTVSSFHS